MKERKEKIYINIFGWPKMVNGTKKYNHVNQANKTLVGASKEDIKEDRLNTSMERESHSRRIIVPLETLIYNIKH